MISRTLGTVAVVLAATVAPSFAADGAISTWVSGAGPSAKTFVLKARGTTFTGAVCGPCDDPATVFRIEGTASDDTHASLVMFGGPAATPPAMALTRVDGSGTLAVTVKSVPAQKAPQLDGRWIAAGRVAQQNFTLKLRDGNVVWGVICGPCDKPAGVFLLEDGALDGDAISFFIHHTDRRNHMKGAITGNVMRFKWVREGRENEPGGEMTLIGPIR